MIRITEDDKELDDRELLHEFLVQLLTERENELLEELEGRASRADELRRLAREHLLWEAHLLLPRADLVALGEPSDESLEQMALEMSLTVHDPAQAARELRQASLEELNETSLQKWVELNRPE